MSSPVPVHRLMVARAVTAGWVVASLVTLAVFATVHGNETRTRTVTRALPAPAAPEPAPAAPEPGPPIAATSPPIAATASPIAATASTAAPPAPAVATVTTVPPTPNSALSPQPTSQPGFITATCPLGLSPPAQPGGLASLIGLAPLFGPFSSEAFAMAPAYAPVVSLFGPFVVQFVNTYNGAQPSLAPLLGVWEQMVNAGFNVFEPLYGPQRRQVIGYETQLATILAPYSTEMVNNPAGACLVDLEGMLTAAAGSGGP